MDSVGKYLSMFNAKNATDGSLYPDEEHPLLSELWKMVCDVVGMDLDEIANDGKPISDEEKKKKYEGKLEKAESLFRNRVGYGLPDTPHRRLVALFNESKKINRDDWGAATGHGRNTISWWINNPAAVAMMTAEDVSSTCRFFGCTVDYLRGSTDDRTAEARAADPIPTDFIATYYERLDRSQRQMISVMVLEMTERNHFLQAYVESKRRQ